MLGMYGVRRYAALSRRDSSPTIGHDKVNYMHPTINYDKWPRKFRPQKRHWSNSGDNSRSSPVPGGVRDGRRCSCMDNLNLTSEQLAVLQKHNHNHNREEEDQLSMQQQTDEILHASADVLTRMFSRLNTNAEPPPLMPLKPDPRYDPRSSSSTSLGKRKMDSTPKMPSKKHGGRYSYSALEDEGAGERLEMERKVARGASRDTSALAARSYLRGHQRYTLLEHLHDIGSRIDKNWFLIRDSSVKTERLMTLQPYDEQCPIPVNSGTKEALVELFQALHHPYIYPVLDVDFANISSHTYVITVIPHNNKGSLKDLIYRSHWQDDWGEKYQQRSAGLPVSQVQRLGRQVLEALLFLQDRGFPPYGHLHSGNVVLQNGVARLSGVENTLLGLTSRIYPIIKRRLRDNRDAIDSVCFGHVLFEMCAGYELSAAHPTAKHLEDIASYPQVVQVLEYIFGNGDQYPSVEEILCVDFFRNLDLREMRAAPLPFQIRYSPTIRNILKEVRRHQKQKSGQRRSHSLNRGDTIEDGCCRKDYRRGRRGAGTASSGEGGGDTPTSSEASAGASGGGDEGMISTSAYNTPTASLATLSSPTSDVTPSPEGIR